MINIDQLYIPCIDNNFDYLLTTSWLFASQSIDRDLLENLMALKYRDKFVLEKTFTLGENKMMLFKVHNMNSS